MAADVVNGLIGELSWANPQRRFFRRNHLLNGPIRQECGCRGLFATKFRRVERLSKRIGGLLIEYTGGSPPKL
jgi:hypothetical protein